MNDSESWDEATKYFEQLKAIVDLKVYGLGAWLLLKKCYFIACN